jgi:peptide/nickel transport system permease protein
MSSQTKASGAGNEPDNHSSGAQGSAQQSELLEGKPQITMVRARQEQVRRAAYALGGAKSSIFGLAVVALMLVVAIFGRFIVPYPEDAEGAIHIESRLLPPSSTHLFGTDQMGRDVFSRVVLATPLAIQTPLIVLSVAGLVGLTLGAIAGFFGGIVDEAIMRTTDVFLTIPDLILAIAVAALLGPGIRNAFLALSFVWWPGYCRLMRGQVLAIREEAYVEAALAMGASWRWTIARHIVPNAINEILVKVSLDVGFVLLSAAALGFIGLGAQPPVPEWGAMVSEARRFFPTWWWLSIFPGAAIFISVLAFNLIGDGVASIARGGDS